MLNRSCRRNKVTEQAVLSEAAKTDIKEEAERRMNLVDYCM